MWVVRVVLVALVIVAIVAFALNNNGPDQTVDINLQPVYNDYAGVHLVVVVFWSFVAGMMLSLLMFVSMYIKLSVQSRSSKKRIKALENEVSILRNRPIEESAELLRGTDLSSEKSISAFKDN